MKVWSIPGGVYPEERKHQSLREPLGTIALPEQLIFPLGQHIGSPAVPVVSVGDKVLAGQKIADAQGVISAPVHASTSGTVVAIEKRSIAHPSGMSDTCIVIAADGKDRWMDFAGVENYFSLDKHVLLEKIRDAGIVGMGGAGFPSEVKLTPRNRIHTLIINGAECEPYITADDVLMQTRPESIVRGAMILAHLLGHPEHIMIGIEDNKPDAIAAMQTAARGLQRHNFRLDVVSFPTKYPSGGEKQLIQILTGQEVPSGKLPANIGVVLQNVGTVAAVFEAVCFGKPLVERITTVVGESLARQRNIRVKLGTPVSHVLAENGYMAEKASRLIIGGPMMGFSLLDDSAPVTKTTNCILAPTPKELPLPPPAQACIRCGICTQACPVNLLPQQMYWYAEAEDYLKLESHHIKDCIECGACSFVCPSNIPLVQYFRAAKGNMRLIATDKLKSDSSRQRFEFRKQRIAQEEMEREAKRAARKKTTRRAESSPPSESPTPAEKLDLPS